MKNILLIGFMGAGKTTVGQLLAQTNGMQHVDFDDKIQEITGCSIPEYFATYGEEPFRQLEHEFLRDFRADGHVLSTGGGIVLKKENREILKNLPNVVYLKTAPAVFIERLQHDQRNIRPLVVSKTAAEIKQVYLPRVDFYLESATFSVDTNERTPQEIVAEILKNVQ